MWFTDRGYAYCLPTAGMAVVFFDDFILAKNLEYAPSKVYHYVLLHNKHPMNCPFYRMNRPKLNFGFTLG